MVSASAKPKPMIMATWSLGRISGWRPIASMAPLPRKPMPMPDPMAARPMPSGSPSPSAAGKSMDSPPRENVSSVRRVSLLVRVCLVRQHHVEIHGREERENQRLHDARQRLEHRAGADFLAPRDRVSLHDAAARDTRARGGSRVALTKRSHEEVNPCFSQQR